MNPLTSSSLTLGYAANRTPPIASRRAYANGLTPLFNSTESFDPKKFPLASFKNARDFLNFLKFPFAVLREVRGNQPSHRTTDLPSQHFCRNCLISRFSVVSLCLSLSHLPAAEPNSSLISRSLRKFPARPRIFSLNLHALTPCIHDFHAKLFFPHSSRINCSLFPNAGKRSFELDTTEVLVTYRKLLRRNSPFL
jgi:hypothetical protein